MTTSVLNSSETFVEGMQIVTRPLDTDMGMIPSTSFVLSVSAETSNYEELSVELYSQNSKSIPYASELHNNWSRLKPTWVFLDSDLDEIEERMSIDYHTEIVDEDGDVRGGVGTIEFYYRDSMPTEYASPVILWAILDTFKYYDIESRDGNTKLESVYNSTIMKAIPFTVNAVKPAFLHFSQNGTLDIHDKQYAGDGIDSYSTIHGIPASGYHTLKTKAVDYPILYNLPKYDSIGGTNELTYGITPLISGEVEETPYPLSAEFLPYELASGISTGGWVSTEVTPLVETGVAVVSGFTTVTYDNADYDFPSTNQMWVSNVLSNKLHSLQSFVIDTSLSALSGIAEHNAGALAQEAFSTGFDVPYYNSSYYAASADVRTNVNELSGQSGIYGIAMDGDKNVWCTDFELDRIYKRDEDGVLLYTIDLRSPSANAPLPYADLEYTWYGPNAVAVDSSNNAYVTLFNSTSGVKIDEDGVIETFFSVASSDIPDFAVTLPASAYEGTYLRPVDVFTDEADEVHVLYDNDDTNFIVKFKDDGTYSADLEFSGQDLFNMAYKDGYIYTSNLGVSGGIYRGEYDVITELYTTPIQIVTCVDSKYVAVDSDDTLWFGYDGNKIGAVENASTVTSVSTFPTLTLPISSDLADGSVIGGIACHTKGYTNVIDTYSNVIYRINRHQFIQTDGVDYELHGIKITPHDEYTVVNVDGTITEISAVSGEAVQSLQAYGDWTGSYWDYKYGTDYDTVSGTETVLLSGSSNDFEVKSFSDAFDLRRYNDSWDMKAQIKSYLLTDYQKEFVDLWDDLIGNTVGDAEGKYQKFGRQFYEKISNFVFNHMDMDLANIDQLYSIFGSLNMEDVNLAPNYPADLDRWMNIVSVPYNRLKGEDYQCNRNFQHQSTEHRIECAVCGQIHPANMGDEIPVTNLTTMTVGTPFVIHDLFISDNSGNDVFYPPETGLISLLSSKYGFRDSFVTNYKTYEYIETPSVNAQSAGLINRSDEYNTLALSGVSKDQWWEDGGYAEEALTQTLYDGLGLTVDYTTDTQSVSAYYLNSLGNYTNTEAVVLPTTTVVGALSGVQAKCDVDSPLADYMMPVFTTSASITGTEIQMGFNELSLSLGVSSDYYGKVKIGTDTYHIPIYTIDRYILPIVGDGVSLINDIVTLNYTPVHAGYLSIKNWDDSALIPVYT